MKYNILPSFAALLMLAGCNPADQSGGKYDVWFNYPELDQADPNTLVKADFETETKLVDLINKANAGSDIHIGVYLFNRKTVSKALIKAAQERNVKVNIVAEGKWRSVGPAQKKILKDLSAMKGADGKSLFKVVGCEKGCNGRVLNNNKFFLFSAVGNDKNVVVQSSANLTKDAGIWFQNSVVIRGDKNLYDGYVKYWQDLSLNVKNPNYFRSVPGDAYPAEGSAQVYLFPQKTGDVVHTILNDIDCSSGDTVVHATIANLDKKRGVDKKLKKLATQGCTVKAIMQDTATTCDARFNLYPEVEVSTVGKRMHSKYISVDGVYQGKRQKVVWTGSHNLTNASLRMTDDTLLEIVDAGVYKSFAQNFTKVSASGLKDHFPALPGTSNACSAAFKKRKK